MDAFSENVNSYDGVTKSLGYRAYRNFKDIEPNRSVRPGFTSMDYHAFRPDEQVPREQKRMIKMCMDAYSKVGIIRNIIDLMGDFGSQGINVVHPNKSAEKFFKQWFKKCNGKERSERFLNTLYRCGNVIVYRSSANVTPELSKYMKSVANDIKVEVPNMTKNVIPWRYNFFNPLNVDLKDGAMNLFMGKKSYNLSSNIFNDKFKNGNIPPNILETLPPKVKRAIQRGEKAIPLEEERLQVFHYKKDDWQMWANPMIYAILDDIIMLEKMRLADLSALDGAISNIRLWTLGNLDHKILPNRAAINKLRDILASNVGGGTMELVWGPELTYTESNSQVYKFLGSEKYQSVLNSIYAGLGVPPTLTGMAGNGGGFTNNFISLKTLVERLQYGRSLLTQFWQHEIELVRKAMGFRYPAEIHYDQMSLADDAAEKNLLIQLADRDIISHETVLERFKELPNVEKIRLKREYKDRGADNTPDKASPFHNPNQKQEMEKMEKQSELNEKKEQEKKPALPERPEKPDSPKEIRDEGRPPFKLDEGPRKQRVETPKSAPGLAETIVWAQSTFDTISEVITDAYLKMNNKKNLRQVTKAEVADMEKIKMDVLTNLQPLQEISVEIIHEQLSAGKLCPKEFRECLASKNIDTSSMNIDSYRRSAIGCYVEYVCK
tara:strand:+ start:1502 stop:3493 length:1992 start_codon:yes stop_codon:yes gene_type:complete